MNGDQTRPKAGFRRWVTVGVMIVVVGLTFLLMRRNGDDRLTRTVLQLRASGEKLTVVELFGEMTGEDATLHRDFNHSLGQLPALPKWVSSIDWMQTISPGSAQVVWSNKEGVSKPTGSPSPLTSWEIAAQDLKQASAALDRLRGQLLKAPHRSGSGYSTDVTQQARPDFVRLRNAAFWLSAAVAATANSGDWEASQNHLAALIDLSSAYDQEPTLVCRMIRVAIANLAATVTWDALQGGQWTEPQLAQLQAQWQRVDAARNLSRSLEGDRAWGFAIGDELRRTGSQTNTPVAQGVPRAFRPVVDTAWHGFRASSDLAEYLEQTQGRIEATRLLEEGAPWAKVEEALNACDQEHQPRWAWQNEYLNPFTSMAIPRVSKAMLSVAQSETLRQMTITAIAIQRHKLRHVNPPSSLDDLVPALLPDLPHDSFSGKPLRYSLTEASSFVLYSVGTNGRDDGGNGAPLKPAKQWTLWDSLDAVLPTPANP